MAETNPRTDWTREQQVGIVLAIALMQGPGQNITPDSWLRSIGPRAGQTTPLFPGIRLRTPWDPAPASRNLIERALHISPSSTGLLGEIEAMPDNELYRLADSMFREANREDPTTAARLFPAELKSFTTRNQPPPLVARSNDLRVPPDQSIQYLGIVQEAATRNGVDPTLLAALIDWESKWDTNARGGAGEIGLGQLMPATAQGLGVTNRADPRQNIEGAARYLGEQLRANQGDESLALGHYNAGPAGRPVQFYIDSVMAQRGKYSNMSSFIPLGSKADGSQIPDLERGRLSYDMSALMSPPSGGGLEAQTDYLNKMAQMIPGEIQRLRMSSDEKDQTLATNLENAYKGVTDLGLKRIAMSQTIGAQEASNSIALMRAGLEQQSIWQQAAASAAKLGFDYYSFDANKEFQLLKYNTIDVPTMQWNQTISLVTLAMQDMVEQHRQIEGEYNAEEGTRKFEITRKDAARKYVMEAEQAYTSFLVGNAKTIFEASKSAGSQFLTYLPYLVTEEMKGKPYPGFEEGGAQETLARSLGYKYTPVKYGDQGYVRIADPRVEAENLATRLRGLEENFPRPQMQDFMGESSTPTVLDYNRPRQQYQPSPLVSSLMGGGQGFGGGGQQGMGMPSYEQEPDMMDSGPSLSDLIAQYQFSQEPTGFEFDPEYQEY